MNVNAANSDKFDRMMNVIDTALLQSNQQDSMARETPSQPQPMQRKPMQSQHMQSKVQKLYILEKEQQDTELQLVVPITSITAEQKL